MHILPEKGESISNNSPIPSSVELRFLNCILDTFELDPLNVLNITPFEGCIDIWSKWSAVFMSPLIPDTSCSICKGTETLEYCSGCKIRAYCCNQHKAQDYWNHVPECKDAVDFENQRSQYFTHLQSIFTNESNLNKQQMRQKIHFLHKCLEDILQHDKKRTPALQRSSANSEFNLKSEQVQQKIEAFCSICFMQSLPQESSHTLPLNELTSFASSWAQLHTHLRVLGLDLTKGVKNVLDSFVKQRYLFMVRMCPTQRVYDLLPKSRWYAHLGKLWNFDASRIFLRGKRYIAHRFPRPSELREYWRLMRAERVEVVVQVNDSVEGGAYWKGKDVKVIEESHVVPKPRSIEYITIRKLEVAMEDGIAYVIHQISYRGWKDALVPLDLDVFKVFLDIVEQYRNKMTSPSLPISVHCMAGWGRTGVFIMLDAQRNYKVKSHLILRCWRKMLLQRELIQNPLQLAFCCGFLHTKEQFSEEHNEELNDMVVEWFRLVGGVLTHKEHPTYELIVNTLKNDESGICLKPQNWWVRMKELNMDMEERELFLYLVRVSKKCLLWILQKQVPLNKLLDIRGEAGIGKGVRNGIQLLYDEELAFLENSLNNL